MVQVSTHGGNCCGMRHIHGFGFRHGGRDQQADIASLREVMANNGNGRYNLEVILSDLQTRESPELMAELARLGFVYTTAFTGQHGTPVHVFHRAKQRLALTAARFNWQGMVASPGLTGELADFNEQVQRNGNNNGMYPRPNEDRLGFEVGQRVRIERPGAVMHGMEARIDRFVRNREGRNRNNNYKAVFNFNGTEFFYTVGNLRQQEEGRPEYRHRDEGNAGGNAPARTRIIREYYALFRNGRTTGPYDSPAAVREAHPRVLQRRRRDIYSDGTVENNDVRFN